MPNPISQWPIMREGVVPLNSCLSFLPTTLVLYCIFFLDLYELMVNSHVAETENSKGRIYWRRGGKGLAMDCGHGGMSVKDNLL